MAQPVAEPRVSADDFFSGLFASLVLKGKSQFSLRSARFDEAVERAFGEFRRAADEEGVRLRFRVALHPLHGESSVVHEGLDRAAQRDLISLANPEYLDIEVKIGPRSANALIEHLGNRELFSRAADAFLATYR